MSKQKTVKAWGIARPDGSLSPGFYGLPALFSKRQHIGPSGYKPVRVTLTYTVPAKPRPSRTKGE